MKLTERLPRQPAWLLVSRILREQAQDMVAQLATQLGLRDRARVTGEDFEIPDSAWARSAVELVAKVAPVFLLNHGVRSYAFGAALGRLYGIRCDPEVLFLATVMNDLGLTEHDRAAALRSGRARSTRSAERSRVQSSVVLNGAHWPR